MEHSQSKVLVIAEHDNHNLSVDTLCTLAAASQIGAPVTLLVMGYQCRSVAEQASGVSSVSEVLLADAEPYQHHLAENSAELVVNIGKNFSHLLAPATTFGKNLLPRVAALLDVGQLSDVVEIVAPDTVIRPIYAGNALAKVVSNDAIKVMTIRSSAFDAVPLPGSNSDAHSPISELDQQFESENAFFVSQQKTVSERPELSAARVVVSGGRGLKSKESFALVEQLADKLGGAIGASRAAVDAGFVSNDLQVGQTGKIVAPELYIAVGISGAIQHLAGMKDSKVIVAINSDPDAPIFQIADYGLVGDLFEVMPELINAL
ncbi:electron transfer flavoprotein subunit alpha/FixB family protein [Vibrio sp.]|uniref:electron transfer flavoprotein subunit alpha/FixB family protein n=1 Tax=Vibrio sp. TaxID=678 RepID=UPI003D0CB224